MSNKLMPKIPDKLLPCPFCGHPKARITDRKIAGSYHSIDTKFVKVRICVICNKCKATGKSIVTPRLWFDGGYNKYRGGEEYTRQNIEKYENMAIEAWNTRIEPYREDGE